MSGQSAIPDYKSENYEIPLEDAIKLAREHHIAGNVILAERTYKDILKGAPDNPTVNHLLGALYFQIANYKDALHYMEESIRISPDEPQYKSNYASTLITVDRLEEAIAELDKALALRPNDAEALSRKAQALWKSDDAAGAETCAKSALTLMPNHLEALLSLGISLAMQKKYEDAARIWQDASTVYPHDARVWSNLANMLRELKKPDEALIAVEKALEFDKDNAEALNNKGCILRDLNRHEEALVYFTKATDMQPNYPQAHLNTALTHAHFFNYYQVAVSARYAVNFKDDFTDGHNALSAANIELGDLTQARFAAQRAVTLDPDNAESYLNLCDVLYLLDRFDDGYAALQQAIKLAPDDHRCHAKMANIYSRLDERDLAIESINKAIELQPLHALHHANKGSILHICNEIEESLKHTQKAIDLDPKLVLAYVVKAEALITIDDIEGARQAIEKVKEFDPHNPSIYHTVSNIENFESDQDPKFLEMVQAQETAKKMGKGQEASVQFALAKAYEKLKNYDKAFEHYITANDLRFEMSPYSPEAMIAHYQGIKASFPQDRLRDAVASKQGFESDSPIFIVGMPRSGTTLTEQIISSHPDVYGAGELPDTLRIRRKFSQVDAESAETMGKLYVEYSRARVTGGDFKHVSDKMPGNFMNIGMIASILPNAKIIHCCRDPMDTCLSNYKQSFLMGQFWSFNMEELGNEHLRYQDLMKYWHEAMPGRILDVHYEDTVNDLETQARRMLDHIGLEWNDACLEPHKQKRSVLTASKMQVTRPVYNTSIKRWKRFEKQLQPLVRKLSPEDALPIDE
jgi:tetratricopeptide (TPR) repeat protein